MQPQLVPSSTDSSHGKIIVFTSLFAFLLTITGCIGEGGFGDESPVVEEPVVEEPAPSMKFIRIAADDFAELSAAESLPLAMSPHILYQIDFAAPIDFNRLILVDGDKPQQTLSEWLDGVAYNLGVHSEQFKESNFFLSKNPQNLGRLGPKELAQLENAYLLEVGEAKVFDPCPTLYAKWNGWYLSALRCEEEYPASCLELLDSGTTADGTYTIDPDGPDGPIEASAVFCDMTTEGGGWTLLLVSSDDGRHTWTMNNRALLTTDTSTVGSVGVRNVDFKSYALHTMAFQDLLFRHNPSGVTAEYAGVHDGTSSPADFMAGVAYPVCDRSLAGNGYPLTGGTLALGGRLCDTDLYFHLGDHEVGEPACRDVYSAWNNATFGPGWSWGNNNGCPFDDPSSAGLGPNNPSCGRCPSGTGDLEVGGRGFAGPLNLNSGAAGAAENYLQMYAR